MRSRSIGTWLTGRSRSATRRSPPASGSRCARPYDGALLGRVPACGPEQVDDAVRAAKAALDAGPLPAWKRAEILDRAAQLLAERTEELARIIATEAAKPIKTARVEAQRAVSTFTFAAVAARTLAGEMVPMDASAAGEGKLAFTLRVPIGVVGAISPFNFPLNLVAHKLAPAIAAGCPVVLKPASQTPLSAITLARMLLDECGLPAGHLNVVTGGGGTVGNAIVDHPDIALITFTGSPEVGWGIRGARAAQEGRARARQQRAADHRAERRRRDRGQEGLGRRLLPRRAVVHLDAAHLRARVGARALPRRAGPARGRRSWSATRSTRRTDVSALISTGERDRVQSWVDEAVAGGRRDPRRRQGPRRRRARARPCSATCTPDMKVCANEVFGPVVGVATYTDLDDALRLANDSRYGLQAAIFTADLSDALKAARTLDYGGVLVNEVPTFRADQQPYGGNRDSGNTREGPQWAVREMTEERLVIIQT